MKRTLTFLLALFALTSCGEDRCKVLKVYNWGDYIDEELLPEFEQWYFEQTGEEVEVIYQTFDINETMLSKIEKGHEDYDVVCPSDYIIERMLRSDLLLPIDRDFGDTPNYIDENVAPYIKAAFDKIDGGGKNANDYSVGYMWGTTGITYNAAYVTDEEASTWNIIRNPKFRGKIFVKDAPRDVFSPVLITLRQKQLCSGEITLDELMYDSSDSSLTAVYDYMREVRELVAGWEADFGKEQMTQEKGYVALNWSGDAVWAIEEAADVGVELRYSVPLEGSNCWFDGWVIPKYAGNPKAAKYFIDYMCKPECALRNMDVIGYVSVVGSETVRNAIVDESFPPQDLSYFFSPSDTAVCANPSVYPDRSVINRCTMMHDWGDDSYKLIEMWSEVKGSNAGFFTYAIITVTFALLLFAVIAKRTRLSRRRRRNARRRARASASGM